MVHCAINMGNIMLSEFENMVFCENYDGNYKFNNNLRPSQPSQNRKLRKQIKVTFI